MILASPYIRIFWNEYLINPETINYNIVLDQNISELLNSQQLNIAIQNFVEQNYTFLEHSTKVRQSKV